MYNSFGGISSLTGCAESVAGGGPNPAGLLYRTAPLLGVFATLWAAGGWPIRRKPDFRDSLASHGGVLEQPMGEELSFPAGFLIDTGVKGI
jgi:hypothetical protein